MRNKKSIIAIVIICIIIIVFFIINKLFFSMSNLPKGEFLTESMSPKGTYTIKAYLCNGGATSSYSIRGELIENKEKNKITNIYWDYKIDKAVIIWLDENTVEINGHKINLPNGKYEWRKDKDKMNDLKNK